MKTDMRVEVEIWSFRDICACTWGVSERVRGVVGGVAELVSCWSSFVRDKDCLKYEVVKYCAKQEKIKKMRLKRAQALEREREGWWDLFDRFLFGNLRARMARLRRLQ